MRQIIHEKDYSIHLIDDSELLVICNLLSSNITLMVGTDDNDDLILNHRQAYRFDDLFLVYNLMSRHEEAIVKAIHAYWGKLDKR